MKAKFEAARRAYLAAQERRCAHQDAMRQKYGPGCSSVYWTKGEREKGERIDAAIDRSSDRMFAVLDAVSPRNWRRRVSWAWIMEHLTWEDATTSGPLSETPQAAYGWLPRELEQFAEAVSWESRRKSSRSAP
jgi:hypothetical protein